MLPLFITLISVVTNTPLTCDEVKDGYHSSTCCDSSAPSTQQTNLETFKETYLRITNADPLWYPGSPGAQDGGYLDIANNEIPLLPNQHGYMLTSGTPRFLSVVEQQLTVTGESKHGMWRIHENGHIREYRIKGKRGLSVVDESTAQDPSTVTAQQQAILETDYGAWHEDVVFGGGMDTGGYRYPSGKIDSYDNTLTFIDLPLHHPKYKGKYDTHVPIDLPSYYCTMSAGNEVGDISTQFWEYATKQQGANEIGPLGKRAGLDITELHPGIIRMYHMPGAKSWANVGIGADTDFLSQSRWDAGERTQTMNYRPIDTESMAAEYYVYMRPFFNIKYLFITAVFDNAPYIRPHGLYHKHIQDRIDAGFVYTIPTTIIPRPQFPVIGYERNGTNVFTVNGMRGYGIHHNNRPKFGHAGSHCPDKGGDWGTWPYGHDQGGGWPTQYQELGPICDAIVVDLRFYAQLGVQDKGAPKYYLPNANQGMNSLPYHLDKQNSGQFTDPYLVNNGISNFHALDTTSDGNVVSGGGTFETTTFYLDFGMQGHFAPAVHRASVYGLNDKNALQALPIADGPLSRPFSITFVGTTENTTVQHTNAHEYRLYVAESKPQFNGGDVPNAPSVAWRIDHTAHPGGVISVLSGSKTDNYLIVLEGWCSSVSGVRSCDDSIDFERLVHDP